MWAYDIDPPDVRRAAGRHRGPATLPPVTDRCPTWCSASRRPATRRPRPWWRDGRTVRSSVVSSQVDLHARYGGVVPELAGRAHVELFTPVVAEALAAAGLAAGPPAVDAVAATCGPGLVGSLLVGLSGAKALAMAWDVPFVGVNHLEGHLFASLLEQPGPRAGRWWCCWCRAATPCWSRCAGPGATGCSARPSTTPPARPTTRWPGYLGLGYPGGPAIDRVAGDGRPDGLRLPPGPARRRATTSPSRASRRRWSAPWSAIPRPPRPTWPPRSKRRWSTCW